MNVKPRRHLRNRLLRLSRDSLANLNMNSVPRIQYGIWYGDVEVFKPNNNVKSLLWYIRTCPSEHIAWIATVIN